MNDVPLAGLSKHGRAEKFFLGELCRFRGKSVDELLAVSVLEHAKRQTYNNRADLLAFCRSMGLDDGNVVPLLPRMERMLQRRHQIVHRADRPTAPSPTKGSTTSLSVHHVVSWIAATDKFVATVMAGAMMQRFYPGSKASVKLRTKRAA